MNAAADDAQSIFVRNLPFSANTTDLEELCGGIGPVKRASIIQSAEGVSRGFGFVKFAIPEDAARAAAILNGTDLKGRNLAVEVAVKRGQKPAHAPQVSTSKKASPAKKPQQEGGEEAPTQEKEEGGEGTTSKKRKAPAPRAAAPGKDEPKRGKGAAAATSKKAGGHALLSSQPSKTLIAFNLAAQTTEKQLYKRIKKIETPLSIKTEDMDGSSRVAILVFETPAAARKVQKKLDQHIVHGNTLSLRPFHPAQQGGKTAPESSGAEGRGEAAAAGGGGGGGGGVDAVSLMRGQAKRNNRLIVRNLSFKATEADLKQALSAFGPVLEATIPKVNVRGVEGRRGFGFVTFACAPDAEKAVKHEGGLKVCGREVAVDMCMGRREYQEEKQKKEKEEQLLKKEEKVEEGTKEGEMEEGSSASEDEEEEEEEGEEEESGEEEEEEAEEEEEDDEEEEEDEEEDDEDEPKEKKPSDIKEGKTIFVRNIPFDATPETLKLAFHDYAPAAFAIIVKDRITGMSKGTAFIKFKTTEGLETVLGAASAAGGSLTLLGRDLKIDRAIEREDAPTPKIPGATAEDGTCSSSKSKADRRNLYLANEGLVIDSEAQDEIPKADLEKRKREQAEKKTKLRNPFFFVSPTRLSIRNLGQGVMDNDLRSLLIKAVQKGLDEGKVTAEDVKMHLQAQGLYEKAADPKCLVIPTPKPRDVHIKVKILRDLDKKPTEGIYPSRGYGFADFSSHVHALAALRHVNNNPAFSSYAIKAGAGKRSRLIVSFAVENHKALQKKILRGEKVRTAAAPEATKGTRTPAAAAAGLKRKLASEAAGERGEEDETEKKQKKGSEEDPAEKRKSRGQRQRERKRQRKEAGEEDEAPRRCSGRQPKGDANGEGKLRKAAAALQQKRGGEKKTSATDPPKKNGRGQRGGADPHQQEDDELTRLAAAAAAANGGEPGGKKGGRRKSAGGQETKEDKQFAQTVSAYKQKLLGGGGGGGTGEDAKGPQKRERWFD